MKKLFVDVETTGLDPKRCGIWEIGCILEIDGKVKEKFVWKMNPGKVEIDQSAIDKSGITREELDKFDSQEEVFKDFVIFLSDYCDRFNKTDKIFFIGYNSKFDESFVREWFIRNKDNYYGSYFYSNSIDIMTLCSFVTMKLRNEVTNYKLETMCKLFDVELINAHKAEDDIKATYELFKKIEGEFLTVNA